MSEERIKKVVDGLIFHLDGECTTKEIDGKITDEKTIAKQCPYYLTQSCERMLLEDAVNVIVSQQGRIHGLEQLVLEAKANEWESVEE